MATCLGYRQGTGCTHRTRNPQKRKNWELWQLCHECAVKLHPEFYKNKKRHGVRKVIEKNSDIPYSIVELPTP